MRMPTYILYVEISINTKFKSIKCGMLYTRSRRRVLTEISVLSSPTVAQAQRNKQEVYINYRLVDLLAQVSS